MSSAIKGIDLSTALTKGRPLKLKFNAGNLTKSPPKGSRWMILSGVINHVTGTATTVTVVSTAQEGLDVANQTEQLLNIASTEGSQVSSLFNTFADRGQSQFSIYIVTDSEQLVLAGAAAVAAMIKVLEW
jgi:hypothetical protein